MSLREGARLFWCGGRRVGTSVGQPHGLSSSWDARLGGRRGNGVRAQHTQPKLSESTSTRPRTRRKGSSGPQQRTPGWLATCAASRTLPLTRQEGVLGWRPADSQPEIRPCPASSPPQPLTPCNEGAAGDGAAGSPGPDDGLAGVLGGRVVHAVEVEPQQDLAPPLGLGVQDLDAGSHPGQRRVGASPAGLGRSGLQHQAEAPGTWVGAGVRAHHGKDGSRQTAPLHLCGVSASPGTLRRQSAQGRPRRAGAAV